MQKPGYFPPKRDWQIPCVRCGLVKPTPDVKVRPGVGNPAA